jgi:hypothetical protein
MSWGDTDSYCQACCLHEGCLLGACCTRFYVIVRVPSSWSQITPEGLHLIPLPFKDDLRAPEVEPSQAGVQVGGARHNHRQAGSQADWMPARLPLRAPAPTPR